MQGQTAPRLNVLDLFCGCGGMTQGIKRTCNIVCGIDIWDRAVESYDANHNHPSLCADLTQLPPDVFHAEHGSPHVDVIVGGPPCQGFSIAGRRKSNDPRNALFMEFCKYIAFYKPRMFLMENVMGILSMKTESDERAIDIIMQKLAAPSAHVQYRCRINKLYASDFGVPQNRRRVIIVGIRDDLHLTPEPILPVIHDKAQRVPVSTVLEAEGDVDPKHFLSERAIAGIGRRKAQMKARKHGYGAQYLKLDQPSYTIPARYWKDGDSALVKYSDTRIRRLTITELKRIQTFPDTYTLVGNRKDQIMQIGNAVACEFAYWLGVYLNKTLGRLSEKRITHNSSHATEHATKQTTHATQHTTSVSNAASASFAVASCRHVS